MIFQEAEREGLKEKEEKRWKNIRIIPLEVVCFRR